VIQMASRETASFAATIGRCDKNTLFQKEPPNISFKIHPVTDVESLIQGTALRLTNGKKIILESGIATLNKNAEAPIKRAISEMILQTRETGHLIVPLPKNTKVTDKTKIELCMTDNGKECTRLFNLILDE